jgi:hypothetical protein
MSHQVAVRRALVTAHKLRSTGKRGGTIVGLFLLGLVAAAVGCLHPQTRLQKDEETVKDKDLEVQTIGDVTEVANPAPILVSGVGLVTGLEGTGGGTPPGQYKTILEKELGREKIPNVKEVLASENNALVLVTAVLPAGIHKDEPVDVEVTLPPYSGVKNLRGGVLHKCWLSNYDSTKNLNPEYEGNNRYLKGHILAWAQGPLLVGFGDNDESVRVKRGRIWGGGVSLIDRPFFLTLNNDKQFARIASAVAERINQTFHDDGRKRLMMLGQVTDRIGERFGGPGGPHNPFTGPTAKAVNREAVNVRVPWEYRLNPPRYLRVVRLIPLEDSQKAQKNYRHKLAQRLLDPDKTMSAALRLEALGSESIGLLKPGLKSDNVLVRFCAADALAYLGSSAGGEELARLVEHQPKLRTYALMALASLNESVCHVKLAELLSSPSVETRYGAFRALHTMDERDAEIPGELLAETFWLHHVAPQSPPLVHVSGSQRAEIVLFGGEPMFVPPFSLVASDYTVTAGPSDDKCTVGYFPMHHGRVERRQCSLKVADVLKTLADMGAGYSEVTECLHQADGSRCLNCPVRVEALSVAPPVEELAKMGKDAEYWKTAPDEETTAGPAPAGPVPDSAASPAEASSQHR